MKKKSFKLLRFKESKKGRYEIVRPKDFNFLSDYNIWSDSLEMEVNDLKESLLKRGYVEVQGFDDGDYVCLDNLKQEFMFCQKGFGPFEIKFLNKLEKFKDLTLKDLSTMESF